MLNQSTISVALENPYTGEISFFCPEKTESLSVSWSLEEDDLPLRSGKFSLSLEPNRKKNIPLSLEIPPTLPGAVPMLRLFLENSRQEKECFSFPLPAAALRHPGKAQPFFTGFRADAAGAIFSSGKLAAKAGASGLQEVTWNGTSLLSRPPRLSLLPAAWKEEELPLLKVIPDRFDADQNFARAHALVLPRGNEEDELELTQTFTPLDGEVIAMDWHFIVPASFAPLAKLGVVMELSGNFSEFSLLRDNGKNGVEKILPAADSGTDNVSFFAFREAEKGQGALLVPASMMKISLSAGESGNCRLFCGINAPALLSRGCYHLQILFKALRPGEEASSSARLVRLFHH